MSASGLRSLWSKPKSALGKDPVEGGDRQSTLHTAETTDLFTGYTPAQNGRTNVISSEGGMWQPITQPGNGTSSVLDQPQANLRAAATLPRRGHSPFGPGEMTSDVFTSPVSERVSPVGHWGPTSSATLSSPVSRTSPEMRAFYGSYADPNKTASLGSTSGTTMNPITSPTLFSHSRHFGTDFTTSAAYDQADDDVPFYSRDVSTLPRRNHTIASSAAAYRRRLDRQFDQGPSSTGLLSPSKNSLSAITGGAEEGEDDWEAMLKRKESLIPNDEEENEVLNSASWRPIGYPAFANAHRRFPSQPVSTFGTSPVDAAHSPISTRSGGHQRSESVGVNRLDQGPFASSPIVHGTGFGSGSGAIVRRHQSLNHHAGRNAISRLNGMRNALPEKALLDRSPEDDRQEQSSANRPVMNYNLAPGHQVNAAQQLSQFTYPARPAQKTTPPQARQEPTDPFDQLSLQSLQLNDRRPPENLPSKPVLSSLVTDREDLMRGASQQPFDVEGSRKALDGPASASAYVPPIGHGHHRRHSSSSSPGHYVPKNDAVRPGGTTAADVGARSRHNDGGRSGIANLHGLQTAHPLQARQRIDQLPWHQRADTPTQDSVQQAINTLPMNMRTTQPSTATTMLHGNGPAAYQMPAYYVDSTSQAGNAPLLDMRGNVVHAPQNAMHWPMPMATAPGGVNGLGAAFYASDGNVAHLSTAPLTSHTPPIPQLQPQQQQKSSSNLMDPSLLALIAAKGYNPPTTLFNVHPARARFFVIKSFTEDDVQRSLKHEIWASTEKGNQRLDRAFKESSASGPLYLLFSVNASGHFCGVAEMLTPLDYTSDSTVWVQEGKWKGTFKVRWIYVKDVPNNRLRHIRLTNTTDCKPITQSRDTQELPSDGGRLALKIIAEFPSRTTLLQGSLLS